MSGKIMVLVLGMTQIYFLISMKKILLCDQLLTRFVLPVQCLGNVLLSEFLKKNGEFGEAFFSKVEKFLENFLSIEAKSNGLKLGRA